MRKSRGLAIILFAILLQLCSSGMELLALVIGTVGVRNRNCWIGCNIDR